MLSANDKSTPAFRTRLNVTLYFRRKYGRTDETGALKNISETGAYLAHSDLPLEEGTKVHLHLSFLGHQREIVAEVIWTNHTGSGIRFLPHVGRDQRAVDDFIEYMREVKSERHQKLDMIFKKVG